MCLLGCIMNKHRDDDYDDHHDTVCSALLHKESIKLMLSLFNLD